MTKRVMRGFSAKMLRCTLVAAQRRGGRVLRQCEHTHGTQRTRRAARGEVDRPGDVHHVRRVVPELLVDVLGVDVIANPNELLRFR